MLKRLTSSKLFLPVLLGIFCVILFVQADHYYKWSHYPDFPDDERYTIHTDGAGYYGYLPEWFLFETEKPFEFIQGVTEKHGHIQFQVGFEYNPVKQEYRNKCYPGYAISSTPVFLITCGIHKLLGSELDGYTWGFELMVIINSILFWLTGCIAIIKLLRLWNLSNWWIAVVIASITFATSINFFIVYFPSFAHVCSFMWVSWFFYMAAKWAIENKNKHFLLLFLLLGMVFIVRPTNILVAVFIPFMFPTLADFLKRLKELFGKYKVLLLGLALFLSFVFIQFLNVHWQIGEWKLNLYVNEGFDYLFNPQIFNVLFSYKKGFFIYAPVMFLVIIAFVIMWKYERSKAIGWLLTFGIFLYLTSSWWCWWYGGGLGMRPFVDIMLLLFLPLIFFFKYAGNTVKWVFLLLIIPCIYVYQIFQVQYTKNIIHWDLMDKETFWQVFLETDDRFSWAAAFEDDKMPSEKPIKKEVFYFHPETYRFEKSKSSGAIVNYRDFYADPNMVLKLTPKSSWNTLSLGILTKFEIKIGVQKSNPAINVSYFKNGKELKHQIAFTGYRIDDVHKFASLEIPFYSRLQGSEVDSIIIDYGKGEVPTSYKNISIEFLGFDEKNK